MAILSFFVLMREGKAPAPIVFDAGAYDERGTTLVSRASIEKRAFIAADIGAARPGLNVLARARSGAMFSGRPPLRFHLSAALFRRLCRVLSLSSRVFLILPVCGAVVKEFFAEHFFKKDWQYSYFCVILFSCQAQDRERMDDHGQDQAQ